jgi:hypothetical protein
MPDITMCKNKECPFCFKCYRFTAIPSEYGQYYATFQPDKNGKCDFFLEIKKP